MSAYIIAQVTIENRERYSEYERGFLPIFAKYDGELLVVEEDGDVLEGEWPCTRTVVGRFPSVDRAKEWYYSPEYQELAQHRWAAANANIVLTRGFPPLAG